MSRRYLLYIHGIAKDDPHGAWRDALDSACRHLGEPTIEERGYTVLAPSYVDLLGSEEGPKAERPPETYKRANDDEYRRATRRYWLAHDELVDLGIRRYESPPSVLATLPADGVHSHVAVRQLPWLEQADRYRRSGSRRDTILSRLVNQLPAQGDLVVIAHSLGSVVARDLIYHLPPRLRLRLLITIGTPLALKTMRQHLEGGNRRFPYEVMGPWVNIVGGGDPVTAFRGLSQVYPQALDVLVDTGRRLPAHRASKYLADPTAALAIALLARPREAEQPYRPLPERPIPPGALSLVVGAQFGLRVGQALKGDKRSVRFDEARQHVLGLLARRIAGNPIEPYEIEIPRDRRWKALDALARDLGVSPHVAKIVDETERKARDSHGKGFPLGRVALVVVGAAAVAVAPVLVLAAAPAGLAGGAAIVGGLAALGPGGMLGGIGIVSVLGGVGGMAVGQALIAGSAAEVEARVMFLQARALTRSEVVRLGIGTLDQGYWEWFALHEMQAAARDDHDRLRSLSDDNAPTVKQLEQKCKTIERALRWMEEEELSPLALALPD